ncbi:MAG: lysostaphin resistance A-like protein [Kordiimonas sp.]
MTASSPSKKYTLYATAFAIFAALLSLRESVAYGHLYEVIPIMGGNIPFFTLTVLIALIYKMDGGTLASIGWRWPERNSTKLKLAGFIALWTIALIVVRILEGALLGPFLDQLGPPPGTLDRMAPLSGNLSLLLTILPVMWLAVIGEEVLFRGFILKFFSEKFGSTKTAWAIAIVISAVLFGICHFWQGPRGMISTGIGALIMGVAYYLCGRNLWPTILSHAAVNTLGFITIYAGE